MQRVKGVILPYISRAHNLGIGMGYPLSYPNHYDCKDTKTGKTIHVLSKNSYSINDEIEIDIDIAHGTNGYFLDKSPPLPPKPLIAPAPAMLGTVDSDVILTVHAIETKNKLTIVSGSIFYFDPKLKNLTDSLRSEFREKAAISVTTNLKSYDFSHGNTYIFPNLRDVSVVHHRIHATDARMPRL